MSIVDLPLGKYTLKLNVQSWSFEEDVTLTLTVLKYAEAPIIEEEARGKLKPLFGAIILYSGYTKIVQIEEIGFHTTENLTIFEDIGGIATILGDEEKRKNELMLSSDGSERIGRH